MKNPAIIGALAETGSFLRQFLSENPENQSDEFTKLQLALKKSRQENPWFTEENLKITLQNWADNLTAENITAWLQPYRTAAQPKKTGLILAGNIPLVGFHDVLCTILSGNIPLIKMSSKDTQLLPVLLEIWNGFAGGALQYHFIEKLENFDAVIATGSNNTARYLEYYFRGCPALIRKNRTSIAVLDGTESDEDIRLLAKDIFTYFGLGCRNVSRLMIPEDFPLDRLFENFLQYSGIINHHKYANNYDYNKALFLLNGDLFWDNNFVMLRENDALFSPLSVLNFSRYSNIGQVENFINENKNDIQCVVSRMKLGTATEDFGQAQNPKLENYADNVDTMRFLEVI